MQTIKCPNCGASVKNTAGSCSYCGSNLLAEPQKNIVNNVSPVTLAAAIENSVGGGLFASDTQNVAATVGKHISKFSFAFVIVFFAIWCGTTLSIAIETLHFGLDMSLIGFVMFGIGLAVCLIICMSFFRQFRQEKFIKHYLTLVTELKFDSAYELGKNAKIVVIGQALIAFYHKKDFDLAGELVLQTNYARLATLINMSPLLINMYEYFGISMLGHK